MSIVADIILIGIIVLLFAIVAVLGFLIIKVRELHLTMNSRLDELIKTTKSLARAEGFREGQEDYLKALRDFKA